MNANDCSVYVAQRFDYILGQFVGVLVMLFVGAVIGGLIAAWAGRKY